LPVIENLAARFSGRARFAQVQVDTAGDVLEAFDTSSFPAYIVYRDGVEVDRLRGFTSWFLETRIERMVERALDSSRLPSPLPSRVEWEPRAALPRKAP
jgi:thioredoxin-like negative regulator of GroEL